MKNDIFYCLKRNTCEVDRFQLFELVVRNLYDRFLKKNNMTCRYTIDDTPAKLK